MRPFLWLGLMTFLLLGLALYGPVPQPSSPAAARADRELDGRQEAALRRIADKEAAIAALIRGELDLAGAAGRFRASDAGDPAPLARLRARHPGLSDDELYRWQVLGFLRSAGRPPAARALAERLENDLGGRRPRREASPNAPDRNDWLRLGKEPAGARASSRRPG